MKSTGIVRRIDPLGRIVIPMELRKSMGLEIGDPLEISAIDGQIELKRYTPSCVFCGEKENIVTFEEKYICPECLRKIKNI